VTAPTPERVAAHRAKHQPCCDTSKAAHDNHVFDDCDGWSPVWCNDCQEKWPCPVAEVLAALEEAERLHEEEVNWRLDNVPALEERLREARKGLEETVRHISKHMDGAKWLSGPHWRAFISEPLALLWAALKASEEAK